ncbi:MAG: YdcF family protein [Patescibacteria group bacterium]
MERIRKILKWLAWLCAAILLLDALLIASFAVFSSEYKKADAIIVMGAAINSPALYNRSIEALEIYELGFAPVIALSGGRISDKDISEATYMQRAMQSKAVKPLNLVLDENSHNTFENLRNSKSKLPNAKSVIIVTDKFHLARSVIMAKSLGFEDVYWHSPEGEYYPRNELIYYYAREFAAIIAYLPKFLFK